MLTERSVTPSDHRIPRRIIAGCEAAVVAVWLLFVLRYQYRVAWLEPYEISLDVLFLAAVGAVVVARATARHGTARVGARVLRLTLAAAVTGVALVGAEYAARFEFRNARSSGNAGDYIARRAGGPPVRVNSLGFREREIGPHAGRFRIAVVGDSFTWGQGVEERERFSNRLEEFLGSRYEVFNFGQPGNNMPEHLDVLAQALKVAPDFVLLQLYINDFETPGMQRPHTYPLLPGSLDRELERSSLLYDLVRAQWVRLQEACGIADSYARYMERHLRDPASADSREAFGQLREFFARARAAGVPAGAVLFPAPDAMGRSGAGYPFGYLHAHVRTVCAEEHVPCLDLLSTFSTFRDPRVMWVSPFDAHPNAMAHRRAAFEMLQTFSAVWRR